MLKRLDNLNIGESVMFQDKPHVVVNRMRVIDRVDDGDNCMLQLATVTRETITVGPIACALKLDTRITTDGDA
jgi:hypothetical protein